MHTKTKPYCSSQQIGYIKHDTEDEKIFFYFYSRRENISKRFLLRRK